MLDYNDCDDDHYEDSSNGGIGTCLAKDQAINHSCHRYNILYACGTRHSDSSSLSFRHPSIFFLFRALGP